MKKWIKRLFFLAILVACVGIGALIADSNRLKSELIRLHVVANSDTQADQAVKLQVRDALLDSLREDLELAVDASQAKAYLEEKLPKLELLANEVLDQAGFSERAHITLGMDAFPLREYDTFSLPSGLYQTLKVVIGEGNGHNWWCVVFPQLCLPATAAEFEETAVEAGLDDPMIQTLRREEPYTVRFYLLDLLGKIENFFYSEK